MTAENDRDLFDELEEDLPPSAPDFGNLLAEAAPSVPESGRRRVIVLALRLVWSATGASGALVFGVQGLSALAVGAQLLLGNRLLTLALGQRAGGGSVQPLLPTAGAFVAVTVLVVAARIIAAAQQPVMAEKTTTHAQQEIMATAGAHELAAFEDPEFYNRLQRAVAQGGIRPMLAVQQLWMLVGSVLGSAGVAAALLALQPMLLAFTALAAVPTWIASRRNARGQFFVVSGTTPDERERRYLQDLLTQRDPAKEVRAFGLADYIRRRHSVASDRILGTKRAEARRVLVRTSFASVLSGVGTGIGAAALLGLLVTDRIPVAGAMTAVLAMQQIRSRISQIGMSAGGLYESALFLEDYASFVAARPASRPPAVPIEPFHRLAAQGLTFSYPGAIRPAVDRVDIEINAGEVVALVGENGSGKTTLAKLLCTLYQPTAGAITWDGIDVQALDSRAMREHITVVFQDFVHYALTAEENIVLGRLAVAGDRDLLRQSVELAGLDRLIEQLPRGLATILGRQFADGQELSGGQWQRVALARAFFRDAPFLVLDEPSASLDARAEHQLFQRIRDLAAGRSVLLITHRFANVRMTDRIYVLHGGQVEDAGTHRELMQRSGRYAELFNLQASQFLD